MESTTTVRKEDGTSYLWRCRELGLDTLLARERKSPLGEAYLFWTDFIHPSVAFDFVEDSRMAEESSEAAPANMALAAVFRVDCSGENPFDFRIGLPARTGPDLALRNVRPDYVRRILAQDLNYVKGSRRPLYQHVHQELDGVLRERYRLLLPVLSRTQDVSEIYGFCRPCYSKTSSRRPRKRSEKSTQDR